MKNMELTDSCARQLLLFLNASEIAEAVADNNGNVKTHEKFKELVDMYTNTYGTDFMDPNKSAIRQNMKESALEYFKEMGIISEKNGKYVIEKERLYNDFVFTAMYKKERAQAAKEILELTTNIPLTKILKELGTGFKLADAVRGASEFLGSGHASKIAEAIIEKTDLTNKDVTDVIDGAQGLAERYIEREQSKFELENSTTQDDVLYGHIAKESVENHVSSIMHEISFEEEEYLYNVKEHVLREDIKSAKELITGETIAMMDGVIAMDKEIRPGKSAITIDQISGELRRELEKKRKTWSISLVNGGKTIIGDAVVNTRRGIMDVILKLQKRAERKDVSKEDSERIKRTINKILKADEAIRSVYNVKYKEVNGMSDMRMSIITSRLAEVKSGKDRSARARGKEFAHVMSQQNLFRCGISQNIPGWLHAIHVEPEDSAWAIAYLKAGQTATKDGVIWDAEKAEASVEQVHHRFMKGVTLESDRFDKLFENFKDSFVKEHSKLIEEVVESRKKEGLRPLDYRVHFNPIFNNPEIKNEFQWESVGVKEYLSDQYSQEQAFGEKGLDAIIVVRNNTVSMIVKGEESNLVSAYIGENGYAKKMESATHTIMFDDAGKRSNYEVFQVRWNSLEEWNILQRIVDERERAKSVQVLRECLPFGYTAQMEDNRICFYDRDGKYAFTFDMNDPMPGGKSLRVSQYCERVRSEFIQALEQDAGGKSIISRASHDIEKIYKDRMYALVIDPYIDKAKELCDILAKARTISESTILDPDERRKAFSKIRMELKNVGIENLSREQDVFCNRMTVIKELHKSDPLLAWTKLILPESERVDRGIKVLHNEKEYVMSSKLEVDWDNPELTEVISKYQTAVSEYKNESLNNPSIILDGQSTKETVLSEFGRSVCSEERER